MWSTVEPCRHEFLVPLGACGPHRLMCGDLTLGGEHTGDIRRIRKNKDVVVAGRRYGMVFINHDGWLFRYKILHNGDRQIVDFILPGQVFGLQACFFEASLYSISTITEASISS